MTDQQMTDAATMIDSTYKPPTIADLSPAVPEPENLLPLIIPISSRLGMLPDSVKSLVVEYLQFDDLIYEGKLVLDDSHIPGDVIFQHIHVTDLEETIRFVFKDFATMHMDIGVLYPALEGLMKNVNFQSYLSFWESVTELILSCESLPFNSDPTPLQQCIRETLDWVMAAQDSPSKDYVLSKVENGVELTEILTRGREVIKYQGYPFEFTPTLPPVFVDVFGQIIAKGDQDSVQLFDQLLFHPTLKKYFIKDLRCNLFQNTLVQMSRTGQPHVFLK